jgi:hypothetical protein
MASLFFTCPTTHQQAPTGIETDVQSLRAAWKATLNYNFFCLVHPIFPKFWGCAAVGLWSNCVVPRSGFLL